MKKFIVYLISTVVVFLLLNLVVVVRFEKQYPASLEPRFSKTIDDRILRELNNNPAQIILLGDSALDRGVDIDKFRQITATPSLKIAVHGSGSAVWYLILKNEVLKADFLPKQIYILFRDTELTIPDYYVNGDFLSTVDNYASQNEPVMIQKAYINEMGFVDSVLYQYLPITKESGVITEKIESKVKSTISSVLFHEDLGFVETAINDAFSIVQLSVLQKNIEAGIAPFYTDYNLDFSKRIDQSFLPEIISMVKKNNIELIFIRLPTNLYPSYEVQPGALKKYISQLQSYLNEQGVTYIDMAFEPQINAGMFFDPVHMNETGKQIFTELLANEIGK